MHEEAAHEAAAGNRALTVLLVDDDALVLASAQAMLEELGHSVKVATSGDHALKLLREAESVDLLITDYSMPHMTGVQLVENVKHQFPLLPTLLVTGYAEFSGRELPGTLHRLNKPFDLAQLQKAIGQAIRDRSQRTI